MGDHVASQAGGFLEVVLVAGEGLVVNQPVGGAAAHEQDEAGLEVAQAVMITFLFRNVESHPQGPAARDDGDLLGRSPSGSSQLTSAWPAS